MSKRQRFIITSIVLSLGFVGMQFIPDTNRFVGIGSLAALTIALFTWSLIEGLGFNMTLISLILPFFFTSGVGIFWFLLPPSVFTMIPIVVLYGIGIYALCLTTNIYTVSAIRTIALLRAARGVGFLLTLFTLFLIFDAIFSLRTPVYATALANAVLSFLLFYQGFWSVSLETKFTKDIFIFSLVASLIIGELSALLFFWPATVVVGSLFLTVGSYMILGMGQAELEGRLFLQTVREYLLLGALVLVGMFFATRWGG